METTLTGLAESIGNVANVNPMIPMPLPQPIGLGMGFQPMGGFGMGGQPLAEMLGQQFQQSVTPMLQQTSDQLSQEIDQMLDQRLVGNVNQAGQQMAVPYDMQMLMKNTLR